MCILYMCYVSRSWTCHKYNARLMALTCILKIALTLPPTSWHALPKQLKATLLQHTPTCRDHASWVIHSFNEACMRVFCAYTMSGRHGFVIQHVTHGRHTYILLSQRTLKGTASTFSTKEPQDAHKTDTANATSRDSMKDELGQQRLRCNLVKEEFRECPLNHTIRSSSDFTSN